VIPESPQMKEWVATWRITELRALGHEVLLVTRAKGKLSQFVKTLPIPWTRQPELTRQ
jgi:hypothetical protein